MDLRTLPNEMLTSIIKYQTFNNVAELRKLNRKIDRAAKTYDVGTRIPVGILSVFNDWNNEGKWAIELRKWDYKNVTRQFCKIESTKTNKPMFEVLTMVFKRVYIVDILEVFNGKQLFDDEYLTFLIKHKKHMKSITYFDVRGSSTCSSEKLPKFIRMLKKLDRIRATGPFIEPFCNPEIYRERTWKEVALQSLSPEFQTDKLNDEFLLTFLHKCGEFRIFLRNGESLTFTVPTIIQLFKKAVSNRLVVNWMFACFRLSSELPLAETIHEFQRIPNAEVEYETDTVLYLPEKRKIVPSINVSKLRDQRLSVDVRHCIKFYLTEEQD